MDAYRICDEGKRFTAKVILSSEGAGPSKQASVKNQEDELTLTILSSL